MTDQPKESAIARCLDLVRRIAQWKGLHDAARAELAAKDAELATVRTRFLTELGWEPAHSWQNIVERIGEYEDELAELRAKLEHANTDIEELTRLLTIELDKAKPLACGHYQVDWVPTIECPVCHQEPPCEHRPENMAGEFKVTGYCRCCREREEVVAHLQFILDIAVEELQYAKVGTGAEVALRHIARRAEQAVKGSHVRP